MTSKDTKATALPQGLDLIAENKKLKATVEELEQFVHLVSHDIKAPLSSLFGLLKLARHPDTSPALLHEYLELMNQSIVQMDNFLQDLIYYSRNLRTRITLSDIDMRELVDDIFQAMHYIINADQVTLEVKGDSMMICSDYMRLKMILNNLISNAIFYSYNEDAPRVVVEYAVIDTNLLLKVSDNGIGIEKEQQEKIFEMFYRVSSAGKGSGLGLYIVKEAVEKLGGQIRVHSSIGVGSSFEVSIPLSAP